jgi:hypothetical protein
LKGVTALPFFNSALDGCERITSPPYPWRKVPVINRIEYYMGTAACWLDKGVNFIISNNDSSVVQSVV